MSATEWRAPSKESLGLPCRYRLGDTCRAQARELVRLEAEQLGEHRLGVLAERRRGTADLRLAAGVQADGRDRHARRAAARMLDVDPEAARLEMGIARHLARRLHRRTRHMRLVEEPQYLVLRAGDRPGPDDVVDLRHVAGAAYRARILRVLGEVG